MIKGDDGVEECRRCSLGRGADGEGGEGADAYGVEGCWRGFQTLAWG